MWKIWQDSPAYGCEDNPTYKWYANYVGGNGHIQRSIGPYDTFADCERATSHTVRIGKHDGAFVPGTNKRR